jgi:hypothetical protein
MTGYYHLKPAFDNSCFWPIWPSWSLVFWSRSESLPARRRRLFRGFAYFLLELVILTGLVLAFAAFLSQAFEVIPADAGDELILK